MKQLSPIQNYILLFGAIMMVVGAGLAVFAILPHLTSLIFAFGTICFALMQMSQTYTGNDITIRRLRHLLVIADILFIISGMLMIENVYHIAYPYIATTIEGYNNYIHYVYNNWVIALLIAAIIELYTTHRISYILGKEREV